MFHPRKIVEAATALCLTARHGRKAVLNHYLTIVPYGNRIHGIRYAARRYLDKPVEDLSWAEIAFLSAIPQAPGRMNPFDPNGRTAAIRRGRRILDLLQKKGVISRDERDLARRQIGSLVVPPAGERPEEALHAVLRLARDSSAWKAGKREVVQRPWSSPLRRKQVKLLLDTHVLLWAAGQPERLSTGAKRLLNNQKNELISRRSSVATSCGIEIC